MKAIHLDFETYCNLDIREVGAYKYCEDKSFEILMAGYTIDDNPIKLWVAGEATPGDLIDALKDPEVLIYAHNAAFERLCINYSAHSKLGWPLPNLSRYRCTAAMGARLALPRDLDRLSKALKLDVTKYGRGKQLINLFCKMQKSTKASREAGHEGEWRRRPEDSPEDWEDFKHYCKLDVEVEREIHKKIGRIAEDANEQKVWEMDVEMNDQGIPIDHKLVEVSQKLVAEYSDKLGKEFRDIVGLNFTQRDKYLEWLKGQGCEPPNLQASTVDELLDSLPEGDVRRTLEIRRSLGRAAVKKMDKMQSCAGAGGRVRGTSLYHGATTGRFSGRLIQPHNFMRPTLSKKGVTQAIEIINQCDIGMIELLYNDPMEVIASCLRGMIAAPKSKEFIVADYSSIEARVLVWLAEQKDVLKQYHTAGFDAYKDMAAFLQDKGVMDVTFDERRLGKAIILGCGFQMGARTFWLTCEKDKMPIEKKVAKRAVKAFRTRYDKVMQFWEDVETAAVKAVRTGVAVKLGPLTFKTIDEYLFIKLPSGRRLSYPRVSLKVKRTKYIDIDTDEEKWFDKETLRFYGSIDQKAIWGHNYTFGGKLTENAVSGIARDLMTYGMQKAVDKGYKVFGTVHDEILSEVDKGTRSVEDFEATICQLPGWAKGIPLAAAGYRAKRYRK